MAKVSISILEGQQRHQRTIEDGSSLRFRRADTTTSPIQDAETADYLSAATHVSTQHAELRLTAEGMPLIKDLNSKNGTWLRLRPHQEYELAADFEIRLGQDLLIQHHGSASAPEIPTGHFTSAEGFAEHLQAVLGQKVSEVRLIPFGSPQLRQLPTGHAKYPLPASDSYLVILHKATPDSALERWVELQAALFNSQRAGLSSSSAPRDSTPWDFVATSSLRSQTLALAKRVARSNGAVLLQGPSGAGKEVLARDIHLHSGRAKPRFIAINCAAIPETLLEGLLFGTSRGTFTGALDKEGLIESADGGTLFLDEIGELPLLLQPKLLRVLEDKKIRRVGELSERDVDIRIIAATNQNLVEMVGQKRFREDLYFRLNTIPLRIPPLQGSDVLMLVPHILRRANREGLPAVYQDEERQLAELAAATPWAGNGRELRSVLIRYLTIRDLAESVAANWQVALQMSMTAEEAASPKVASPAQRLEHAEADAEPSGVIPNDILSCVDHVDNLLFLAVAKEVMIPFRRGAIAALGLRTNMTGAGAAARLRKLQIRLTPDVEFEVGQLDAAIRAERAALAVHLETLREVIGL